MAEKKSNKFQEFMKQQSAIQTLLPGDEGFDAVGSAATPHCTKDLPSGDPRDAVEKKSAEPTVPPNPNGGPVKPAKE